MINIDFLTLKAFFIENIDFFIGARLQKIQQPTRRDFIFSLRNNSESRKLYININPEIYHLSFISAENEKKRHLEIPKQPPMFCMLLRKYLEGCRIADATVIDNERILELYFDITDELSQSRSLCLCVELMGKHSNIILYDKNTSVIIGCAHNVGSEKSRYRELQGGLKYIYPPKSKVKLSNELKQQFSNLSDKKISEYLNSEQFRPALSKNSYTLFRELLPDSIPQNSINEMLDNYYSKIQEEKLIISEKNKLLTLVRPKLKKTKSSAEKIEQLLNKRDKTDIYKLYGELITANLYQNNDYTSSIEVWDYINNKNITIELDKNLTLNENAQRYFRLYTKSKNTKEKSFKILENLKIQSENFENIIYSIESANSLEDLNEIKLELGLEKSEKRKCNENEILQLNINGYDIYVGKNNKQNDYIISRLAKDEDLWFHTKMCAGSHVLLKINNKKPDDETIFECCKLARKYSSAKQPSKVGVIYTERKNLRKPPAAPLGYVTYKNEKEILI